MSVEPLDVSDPSLASRYLAGQLDDDERARFEQRLLCDPSLLREVEATARFKAGLAQARATGGLAVAARGVSLRWWHLAGIAAGLIAFAILIGLWRGDAGARVPLMASSLTQLSRLAGTSLPPGGAFAVVRLRAEGAVDAVIDLPVARSALQLRVLPGTGDPGEAYNVTLQRSAAAEPETRLDGIVADASGELAIFVDSAALQPGRYRLQLEPQSARAEPESFLLEFQRPGLR